MAAGEASLEDITAAKRVAHTLKGSGAIIGLRGLTALGHNFEDVLEHFEKQGGQVAASVADILIDGAYCLEQMVAFVTGTDEYPDQSLSVLQDVLDLANRIDRGESLDQPVHRVTRGEHVSAPVQQAAPPEQPGTAVAETADITALRPVPSKKQHAPAVAPAAALRVNLDRIEELFRVSAEVSVHTAAMEARIKQLTDRARELLEQNLRVQKRLFELETVVDVRALTMMRARSSREASAAFDPLEMDQYNELHSTAHALMEESNDARILSQRIEEGIAQLAGMQTRQQLLSRDLQHLVVGTRMTEVSVLEPRLQRNIRTTSQAIKPPMANARRVAPSEMVNECVSGSKVMMTAILLVNILSQWYSVKSPMFESLSTRRSISWTVMVVIIIR